MTRGVFYFENRGDPDGYFYTVYEKGALCYAALRKQLGDERFFAALRAYYAKYRYRTVSDRDWLETFNAAAGQNLDALTVEWLGMK